MARRGPVPRADPVASAVPAVGPRSWWLEQALADDPGEPCPPLRGRVEADVCVAGGGFAGLWTAYELTERRPGLDVVLLEADICGAGGSGANGGFFSPSWHRLDDLIRRFGEDGGLRWAMALGDAAGELGVWCERHGADIDYHHDGDLFGRFGEWQTPFDEAARLVLERHGQGARERLMDAEQARRVVDSPRLLGGVFSPDSATIQPAKLVRELRRVLLERGVRIFEHTRMTRWLPEAASRSRVATGADATGGSGRHGRPVRVETAAGYVRAGHLVLAHGAWAAAEPAFSRAFAVAADFMVVTEPIPELLAEIGWTSHVGVADRREMLYYLRRTADDRIAIGGGGMGIVYGGRIGGRALVAQRLADRPAQGLVWLIPQLEGVRFAAAWSGPMDLARSSLPFFMTLPGGTVHAGLGFSGHGLTSTMVGGRVLASLVLGEDDEWARLPVVGPPLSLAPPEPLRWPLVRLVEWAYERGERAAERRGRPGIASRAAAAAMDRYAAGGGRSPAVQAPGI